MSIDRLRAPLWVLADAVREGPRAGDAARARRARGGGREDLLVHLRAGDRRDLGRVRRGKTVAARAAVAGLDASRHTVLYLGTPGVGLRGIYGLIVTALGGTPRFHHAALIPKPRSCSPPSHRSGASRSC